MKSYPYIRTIFTGLVISLQTTFLISANAQDVSNVSFKTDDKNIQICYDLSEESDVSIYLSTNGGRSFDKKPLPNLSGAAGKRVQSGTGICAVWDVLADRERLQSDSVCFKVYAKGRGQRKRFTVNGVNFTLVQVEGGSFTMGCTSEQGYDCENDEKPSHRVTLDNYYIGETEVTQALWKAVMGSNPSSYSGDDLPVENVSYNDITTFILKLNGLTGSTFRLPTEAEWEYAARGGKKSRKNKFSGADNTSAVAWCNGAGQTHPVAQKQPNELGLYDMSGNVAEWCYDWYDAVYYANSEDKNPSGPSSGMFRVLRGGNWFNNNSRFCRVTVRSYSEPTDRNNRYGFRLALTSDDAQESLAANKDQKGYGEAISGVATVSIMKDVKPPILTLVGDIKFDDPNKNNAIDAGETCMFSFMVKNTGIGDGYGMIAHMLLKGEAPGISGCETELPPLPVGQAYTIQLPISANLFTVDGTADFLMSIEEPHGFGLEPQLVSVPTRAFVSPMVEYVGYVIPGGGSTVAKNQTFDMDVTVQNTGQGVAENTAIKLVHSNDVFLSSANNPLEIGTLEPGQAYTAHFTFAVPQSYNAALLPISVLVSERHGRFSKNGTIDLHVDQSDAEREVTRIVAKPRKPVSPISPVNLGNDVDTDIPEAAQKDDNLYVLIIANGNYESGDGVSTAIHDGEVMQQYCIKALGAQPYHVTLETDAGFIKMGDAIDRFADIVERHNEDGRFLFFYYGHGAPSPKTSDAYLIPVDLGQGSNMERYAISRNDLIARLQVARPQQMVICLEACFNGGTNEGGGKHIYTQANTSAPMLEDDVSATSFRGNIVLLTASSGSQSAHAMPQGAHNLFTYQLMKAIKESGDNATWGDIFRKASIATQDYSQLEMRHSKAQTPSSIPSSTLGDAWESWKLRNEQ